MSTFKQMTQSGVMKRADATKIRLDDIHEEPGFNLRDTDAVDDDGQTFWDGISDFAKYIANGGMFPALEVRPRPEGGVWIVEGHRRRLALLEARDKLGAPIEWVNVVQFTGNDAERTARIITSQDNRKLKPVEMARGVKRLVAFGLEHAEIAKMIGRSVQRVVQLLELANANTDVQKMVAAGGVSATEAAKVVREHGDNAGKVLGEAMERAKAAGKKKVTAKTLAADKPKALPAKVAQELETAAWELSKHLDLKTHEVLERGLRNGVSTISGADVLVPAGFLLELVMAAQAANDARGNQAIRVLADQQAATQKEIEA